MKENIKRVIIEILSEKEEIPLTGLKHYESFNTVGVGEYSFELPNDEGTSRNILIIDGVNKDCIDCFVELLRSEIIVLAPTEMWVFIHEGAEIYVLPIAHTLKTYKELHWKPMLLKRGSKFKELI